MRIELWILAGAILVMANIYTDGKLWKTALSYKKYYQMAAVAVFAFMVYWALKKNPQSARTLLSTSNEYLKYLPVDRNTSSMIAPILDFTSKYSHDPSFDSSYPLLDIHRGGGGGGGGHAAYAEHRVMSSGTKGTKRSVSETKKKWVAAKQNWHCGHCKKQLPPWFEVDHIVRLEHGGSNHVDNLVALCRDCHGQKTAVENL